MIEMTRTDQIAQISNSGARMTSIPSQIGSSSFKRSGTVRLQCRSEGPYPRRGHRRYSLCHRLQKEQ